MVHCVIPIVKQTKINVYLQKQNKNHLKIFLFIVDRFVRQRGSKKSFFFIIFNNFLTQMTTSVNVYFHIIIIIIIYFFPYMKYKLQLKLKLQCNSNQCHWHEIEWANYFLYVWIGAKVNFNLTNTDNLLHFY